MADHTVVGHQIVSTVQFPWPKIPEAVRSHHERSDGSGYPDALMLDDLSMPVRIIGIADAFDAMTSARPYREPLSVGSALSDLVRLAPQKYDPNVVQAAGLLCWLIGSRSTLPLVTLTSSLPRCSTRCRAARCM
jgi:HD-GYP domain-containing protein (c-di-GMP phosphodiesterase class II)